LLGLAFTRKVPTIPTATFKQPSQFPAELTRAGSPDPASRGNNRTRHPTFKSLGQKCRFSQFISASVRMTDLAINSPVGGAAPAGPALRPNLDKGFNPLTMILFCGILAAGLLYGAYSIYVDIDATGMRVTAYLPYILPFVALLIALGFEFVNGFYDTANAVATVIYTHSLPVDSS
jgi:hypothetical protein